MQKKQDHILWTLESKRIDHEQIDIGDPNHEKDRQFMRENVDAADKTKTVLPPQIFNDEEYVGVSIQLLEACRTVFVILFFQVFKTLSTYSYYILIFYTIRRSIIQSYEVRTE